MSPSSRSDEEVVATDRTNMRIALLQLDSPDAEPQDERLARVCAEVESVATGADLVVLPELWGVGFNHPDQYRAAAEPIDGPTISAMAAVAARCAVWIAIGSFIHRADEGKLYNTAGILDRRGRLVLTTPKIHTFPHGSAERQIITPGRRVSVVDTEFGRLATVTCYDLRFTGLWNTLADAGADIVIVPAAWPASRLAHWRALTTARALDTSTYVIGCNARGVHGGIELAGHSRVVGPWGETVAEADEFQPLVTATIDPRQPATTRQRFPFLQDRLEDYRSLLGPEPS